MIINGLKLLAIPIPRDCTMTCIAADDVKDYLKKYTSQSLMENLERCEKSEQQMYLLMECVVASANNAVYASTQKIKYENVSWSGHYKNCSYWAIQRYGLLAAKLLGRLNRKSATDLRCNRLWSLLDTTYQSVITEESDFRKRIYVDSPCFSDICKLINKKNIVIGRGVIAVAGHIEVCDDEYGCPSYARAWKIVDKNGSKRLVGKFEITMAIFTKIHGRQPTKQEILASEQDIKFWWSSPYEPYMTVEDRFEYYSK